MNASIARKTGFVLALLAAAAAGYCLHPTAGETPAHKAEVAKKRPSGTIPDRGDDARYAALRQRVRALEAQLAASRKDDEEFLSNAVVRAETEAAGQPPRRLSGRERMEELKKRDPARFAQMTNRMARMHQERKSRQAERASFLSSVNTSGMSARDRQTHDEYQQLLARREALEEQMHQPDLSDEARRELMDEMRDLNRQMRTLGESERNILLGEVARTIGMEGDAAGELVQTIREVVDATDSGRGPGGPHGPPPDGGR